MEEIQTHSKSVIERCYAGFLIESSDPEEREYPDDADQIREILLHGNYFSQKDIEFCAAIDMEEFAIHPNLPAIKALHNRLRSTYCDSAPTPVAG